MNDEQRYKLHTDAITALGKESATVLMEHLPPVGWSDVVRQSDLLNMQTVMNAKFDQMDARMDAVDIRLDAIEDKIDSRFEQSKFFAAAQSDKQIKALIAANATLITLAFLLAKLFH